jgi:RNA polymerase sigma-70 factor (ECF subfamily)
MEPRGSCGELSARRAGVEVGFDHGGLDAWVLTVETGRDRVTDVSAAHTGSVAYEGSGVPPVSSVVVDHLTRLWLEARDGDRASLLQAIRASQADVWRLALHLVGENDADDATQDTFVRAWRALPAFRGDSSARTWLLAIARRACADSVRGAVRRRRMAHQIEQRRAGLGDDAGDPTGAHSLHALVDGLDRDQRVAFVLTQIVGCSYGEAAEICGVPVGTIRSRVARARERLVAEVSAAETG